MLADNKRVASTLVTTANTANTAQTRGGKTRPLRRGGACGEAEGCEAGWVGDVRAR